MSTEKGVGAESLPSQGTTAQEAGAAETTEEARSTQAQGGQQQAATLPSQEGEGRISQSETTHGGPGSTEEERKPAAKADETSQIDELLSTGKPRQVIAVSASKGPAAFFNLARKFLVTDEMCDLSALEGAIVSAVDAAHLLERSQLATIVRVNTSYVTVEPKRRKQAPQQEGQEEDVGTSVDQESSGTASAKPAAADSQQEEARTPPPAAAAAVASASAAPSHSHSTRQGRSSGSGTRELRRARIVITVRRTESYKRWLEENPLQAIIAGDTDEAESERAQGERKPS